MEGIVLGVGVNVGDGDGDGVCDVLGVFVLVAGCDHVPIVLLFALVGDSDAERVEVASPLESDAVSLLVIVTLRRGSEGDGDSVPEFDMVSTSWEKESEAEAVRRIVIPVNVFVAWPEGDSPERDAVGVEEIDADLELVWESVKLNELVQELVPPPRVALSVGDGLDFDGVEVSDLDTAARDSDGVLDCLDFVRDTDGDTDGVQQLRVRENVGVDDFGVWDSSCVTDPVRDPIEMVFEREWSRLRVSPVRVIVSEMDGLRDLVGDGPVLVRLLFDRVFGCVGVEDASCVTEPPVGVAVGGDRDDVDVGDRVGPVGERVRMVIESESVGVSENDRLLERC